MYVCAVARECRVYFIYVLYKVMLKCLKSCHKLFICAVIAEDVLAAAAAATALPFPPAADERAKERIRIYLRAACYFKMIIFIVDHDWGRFRPGALCLLFIVRPLSKKHTRLLDCDGDLWQWICVELITGAAFYCLLNALTQFSCILYIVSRLSNNNPSCQRLFK